MHNPLLKINNYGQSIWMDNLSRSLIESGELEKQIENYELRGITSNPAIFEKAMQRGLGGFPHKRHSTRRVQSPFGTLAQRAVQEAIALLRAKASL